jgi:hypothetical protein
MLNEVKIDEHVPSTFADMWDTLIMHSCGPLFSATRCWNRTKRCSYHVKNVVIGQCEAHLYY